MSSSVGYDANGNPGGPYSMSAPPPGKRFGSFFNGGRQIIWLDANKRAGRAPRKSTTSPGRSASAASSANYRSPYRSSAPAPTASSTRGAEATPRSYTKSSNSDLDLYVAASLGQVAEVTRLIGDGGNPNERGLEGDTCLNAAVTNGHAPVVAVLLQAGADPSAQVDGRKTALHSACEVGHDTVVAALLSAGANPRATDANGETPRDAAARLGHPVCAAVIDRHAASTRSAGTSRTTSPAGSTASNASAAGETNSVKARVRERRERLAREREEAHKKNETKQAEIRRLQDQLNPTHSPNRQVAEMMFDSLDKDNDGVVSKAEFRDGMLKKKQQEREQDSVVDRVASKHGRGGESAAPPPVPAEALPPADASVGEQLNQMVFNKLDEDGDGQVSAEEFRHGLAPSTDSRPRSGTVARMYPHSDSDDDEHPVDNVDDAEIAALYSESPRPDHGSSRQAQKDMEDLAEAPKPVSADELEVQQEIASLQQNMERQKAVEKHAEDNVSYGKLVPALLDLEKLGGRMVGLVAMVRMDMKDAADTQGVLDSEESDEADLKKTIADIGSFEETVAEVGIAETARECEPLVKSRRGYCKNLVSPVKTHHAQQTKRGKLLEGRLERCTDNLQVVLTAIGGERVTGTSDGSPAAYSNSLDEFAKFMELPPEDDDPEDDASAPSGFTRLILDPLQRLVEYSGEDAKVFSILVSGFTVDTETVARREAQREECELMLYASVQEADAACRVLMREAKMYLQTEKTRVTEEMERSMGLAAVLDEKLQILVGLPQQEAKAKNLLKALRKADKNQRKVRARIIAVENRLDEADELGQISSDSESEEEWSDDDEDFYLGDLTVDQLKGKQEDLRIEIDDLIEMKKQNIYELIQLTEKLPELRFHPKLKPAVAAFQRERLQAQKDHQAQRARSAS